jgi:hypothetical protein
VEYAPSLLTGSGLAALLFAVVFIAGGSISPLRRLGLDPRSIVSFSAGLSAAYVFVQLMPELGAAQHVLAQSTSLPVRVQGRAIYFCALLGFLTFNALEFMRRQLPEAGDADTEPRSFRMHIGSFAVYVGLVSYLLLHTLEHSTRSIVFYAFAMAAHFLAIDHALRREHGTRYLQAGRWWLAAMAIVGWAAGVLFAMPPPVVSLLLAFVAGAVIINSAVAELPTGKDGRMLPFIAGGVIYGALLWLLV